MNLNKCTWVIPCAVISALATTVSIAAAQENQHRQSSAPSTVNERTIRGAWRTVVTPRNCQTGDAILTLTGLFTFNQGGTMSEYGIGPGSSPARRNPGHGVWQRPAGSEEDRPEFTSGAVGDGWRPQPAMKGTHPLAANTPIASPAARAEVSRRVVLTRLFQREGIIRPPFLRLPVDAPHHDERLPFPVSR
jgi:hypothetical protein